MSAGYSGTPLSRKLGIKEGHRVALLNAPNHVEALLAPLPSGVRIVHSLRGPGAFDVLLVFVRDGKELRRGFSRAAPRMKVAGGLWMSWPKASSVLATELREGEVRAQGLKQGLVDNKICAVDEDWSSLRFVVRLRDRSHS